MAVKIQTFHTKTLLIYWCEIHPINQEYLLVQRKKLVGFKMRFRPTYFYIGWFASHKRKNRKPVAVQSELSYILPL